MRPDSTTSMAGVAAGDGGVDLVAGVRCGARGQVVAEQEGDLTLDAAEAMTGEHGSAGGDPRAGHGGEGGFGVGAGRAYLPAADLSVGLGEPVLDEVGLGLVDGAEVFREVSDGLEGAAGVEEKVGGFDELGFAQSGHEGVRCLKGVGSNPLIAKAPR